MDKKILFVSETVLFPMDRGNRKRNVNLIETLKKEGCTVDFLYLDTYPEEDTSETEKYIGENHFFRIMNRKRTFPVFLKPQEPWRHRHPPRHRHRHRLLLHRLHENHHRLRHQRRPLALHGSAPATDHLQRRRRLADL